VSPAEAALKGSLTSFSPLSSRFHIPELSSSTVPSVNVARLPTTMSALLAQVRATFTRHVSVRKPMSRCSLHGSHRRKHHHVRLAPLEPVDAGHLDALRYSGEHSLEKARLASVWREYHDRLARGVISLRGDTGRRELADVKAKLCKTPLN
jgi:hypothetical protein